MYQKLCYYSSEDGNVTIVQSKDTYTEKEAADGVLYPLHNHKYYEVFRLECDRGVFHVEGQQYQLEKGDVMVFNSRELHQISLDVTEYQRTTMHFPKGLLAPYQCEQFSLAYVFENTKMGQFNRISAQDSRKYGIEQKIEEILCHVKAQQPQQEIMIKTNLIQLLVQINIAVGNNLAEITSKHYDSSKVEEVLQYINQNLESDLSLDHLADQFFISKYHLCHLFKDFTGFSIGKYITYKRVMWAEDLISEGISAMEACLTVGFNDYSNFYKTFIKVLGHPPKMVKKK